MVELKYYTKRPPHSQFFTAKPKGVVLLTAAMELILDNDTLMLVTKKRTYYFRPGEVEDFTSGEAMMAIGKWKESSFL